MRSASARWVLVLALALAAWERAPAVFDDRSWFDETYVFLESMGISFLRPWPASFTHASLDLSPRLGTVLDHLAHEDAYPPLVHVITWSFRAAPNPLLAARAVFVICGLVLIGVVFRGGLRLGGPGAAAILTLAVAGSPMLTSTGQELKWYALAPLLAMAATLLLLDLDAEDRWRWVPYVLCLVLLAQTHYFCFWILPAHALFAWWRRPALRGRFAVAFGVVLLACAPWLVWGLPKQSVYVRWHFENVLPRLGYNAWYQPTTVKTVVASWLYTLLAVIGWQPSPVRSRYLVPVAVLAGGLLARGWFAADSRCREFVRVSVVTFAIALAAQTAYSVKLGQVTPLTATYFAAWCPLVAMSVLLGALEFRDVRLRAGLAGALVAGAAVNLALLGPPRREATIGSLSHYRAVAAALRQAPPEASAIVFRSDTDAKMVNVFYDGPARQLVWAPGAERTVPPAVSRLVGVSATDAPPLDAPAGWISAGPPQILGHARIERLERAAPPVTP